LKFIPIIYMKRLPIQFVSIALISIGAFMSGMAYNEMNWQLKVKEMEAKVAQAEAQAAKENVKIVEKIIVRQEVIREKGDEIIKYIDREIVKFDDKCEIPKEVVNVINKAAEGRK
jgi:4-hydroxyphenylpyruvate dioxygenase-like putative hemolysin